MRRVLSAVLLLLLAVAIHADWHLARPAHQHHRLSLGWRQHWLFAVLAFAAVGGAVGWAWPRRAWATGGWIAAGALLLAQGIEPMAEVALFGHRLGYPEEPGRWAAFALCVAAGLPAYGAALWLCGHARRRRTGGLAAAA